MSWYSKLITKDKKPLIFWHATTPKSTDEDVADKGVYPANILEWEKNKNYINNDNIEHNNGIYLTKNKNNAIHRALVQLQWRWREVFFNSNLKILNNETINNFIINHQKDLGYIALFKILIMQNPNLINVEEFFRQGEISNQPNNQAWYEGPMLLDFSQNFMDYIKKLTMENYTRSPKDIPQINSEKGDSNELL